MVSDADPSRLCLSCRHVLWQQADGAFSEDTPGIDFGLMCLKQHWTLNTSRDQPHDLRRYLEMAQTCPDFVLSEEAARHADQPRD